MCDIGDRDIQAVTLVEQLAVNGIIEIARVCAVDGNEGEIA